MPSSNTAPDDAPDLQGGTRAARIEREIAVLMSLRGQAWQSTLVDISATGLRVGRPKNWHGTLGETWVLDLLFDGGNSVPVTAALVRIGERHLALRFTRIPDPSQERLWSLLGRYADSNEAWRPETLPEA